MSSLPFVVSDVAEAMLDVSQPMTLFSNQQFKCVSDRAKHTKNTCTDVIINTTFSILSRLSSLSVELSSSS